MTCVDAGKTGQVGCMFNTSHWLTSKPFSGQACKRYYKDFCNTEIDFTTMGKLHLHHQPVCFCQLLKKLRSRKIWPI